MLFFVTSMLNRVADLIHRDEKGASAVEYGLLVALIAAVIVTAVTGLGAKLVSTFNSVVSNLPPGQ